MHNNNHETPSSSLSPSLLSPCHLVELPLKKNAVSGLPGDPWGRIKKK
jgi:hypothetical protein